MTTVDVHCECPICPCPQLVAISTEDAAIERRADREVLCLACEMHDEGGEG